MADHSKPLTTSTYSNFVTELDARFDDLAVGLDPAVTTATNLPTNAIRWTSASNKWQKWNGTAWGNLSTSYDFGTLSITSTAVSITGNTTLGDASTDTVTVYGKLGFGSSGPATNTGIYYRSTAGTMTGSTSGFGLYMDVPFASDVTANAEAARFRVNTAASAYTVTYAIGLRILDTNKGAGSTITNQYGLYVEDQTQGTNNFGVITAVSSGTYKYNIYAGGTAQNYFAGSVGIGTSSPATKLHVKLGSSSDGIIAESLSNDDFIKLRHSGSLAILEASYISTGGYTPLAFNTNGSERMRIDTSGNVGIGKTTMTYPLDVAADSSGNGIRLTRSTTTEAVVFQNSTGGTTLSTSGASAFLAFGTGTTVGSPTERMRIDSAGNLGLGVTPSASTLPTIQSTYGVLSGNTNINIMNNAYYSSGWKYTAGGTVTAAQYQQDTGRHIWYSAGAAATHSAGDAITFTQAMTLDSSGRLLVGQTSGQATVSSQANTSGYSYWSTNDSTLNYSQIYFGGTTSSAFTFIRADGRNGGYLAFGTNDTERARIDSSGNLQVEAGSIVRWAPAPASISTTATLTNANIQGQIINTTGTSYTVTMPLGTTMETLVSWATTNLGYDFYVVNTASGTITMAVNTGVTSLGTLTVATGVSAHFRIRRTAANTFVLYRLS